MFACVFCSAYAAQVPKCQWGEWTRRQREVYLAPPMPLLSPFTSIISYQNHHCPYHPPPKHSSTPGPQTLVASSNFPPFLVFLEITPPSLYTHVSYRSDNAGCAWQHRAGGHNLLDRPALFINHVKWSYTGKNSIAHLDGAQIDGSGQRLICLLHYLISVIDML